MIDPKEGEFKGEEPQERAAPLPMHCNGPVTPENLEDPCLASRPLIRFGARAHASSDAWTVAGRGQSLDQVRTFRKQCMSCELACIQ